MTSHTAVAASDLKPHLLVTAEPWPGLRSLSDVRSSLRLGFVGQLWDRLRSEAEETLKCQPYLPTSPYPDRPPHHVTSGIRDFVIVDAVCRRLKNAALVWLLTQNDRFLRDVLAQMEALFDRALWPGWVDQAHADRYVADLRTGMLLRAFGFVYDWTQSGLSASERHWIVDNLDRRAIQPYLQEVARGTWFTGIERMTNWQTVVVGGAAVAAMALGDAHPSSERILVHAKRVMDEYILCLGPEGEFNESVAYAGSTQYLVEFFAAYRYHGRGGPNPLSDRRFLEFCRWYMYFVLPPGRVACFGDSYVHAPPQAAIFAAAAAASRDPVLQWFYLNHNRTGLRSDPALELLFYDPTLEPVSPEGRLPRGRAYRGHGALWSSRTDWPPSSTACVVYGKAGHGDECHGNHDAGQVCIDAWGERLIVDLGSPSGYPLDFFTADRWRYYNAGVVGHNVLMFDGREMRTGEADLAQVLDVEFDDRRGGWWRCDTTALYDGACAVQRTVIHLHPAVIAVLDEAVLERDVDISLRWHTADACTPTVGGAFLVKSNGVHLASQVVRLDGLLAFRRGEHAYTPPYNRARLGPPLDTRRESYVEALCHASSCRILSLFAAFDTGTTPAAWTIGGADWRIETPEGEVVATVSANELSIRNPNREMEWSVPLRPCPFPQNQDG